MCLIMNNTHAECMEFAYMYVCMNTYLTSDCRHICFMGMCTRNIWNMHVRVCMCVCMNVFEYVCMHECWLV